MSGLLRLPNGLIKEFPEVQQFQVIFGAAGDIVLLLKGRGFETHRETHLLDTLRFIPPAPARVPAPAFLPLLPDAGLILETIANTSWATIATEPGIEGRKDYLAGTSSESKYFRFLPYLDFDRVGDHKVIWELNRRQHMVVLAQAWRLTGNVCYKDELFVQIQYWRHDNPVQHGIKWASA